MEKITNKFQTISTKLALIITFLALLLFIIINLVMAPYSLALNTYTIVDFELAWMIDRSNEIMTAWGQIGISNAIILNWVDFVYILGYSIMGWGLIMIKISYCRENKKYTKFGYIISTFPLIAGVCDVIENFLLQSILYGFPATPNVFQVFFGSLFAFVKFALLVISLCIFIILLVIERKPK